MKRENRNPDHVPTRDQGSSYEAGSTPLEVSVIIKTLNEEANIARAIESALAALEGLSGEVIIADSLSVDRTVEIAGGYPVTVVQLCNPQDRCCGAGPQLGFQYAHGEFVYLLDGDMELDRRFLPKGVKFLREHTAIAGVAGIVEELGGGNYEFEARKSQGAAWGVAGVQPWLDMGGLYRTASVARIGYLSNRNLHACEEQDLGLRLGPLGERLVRLPIPSVRHYGRTEASWELMKRRFTSRYSDGPGELVRATVGTPLLWKVLSSHSMLVVMAGFWLAIAAGLLLLPWTSRPLLYVGVILLILVTIMLARKRSFTQAALGLMNWELRTAGFVRGLLLPQVKPETWLESRIVATSEYLTEVTASPMNESGESSHASHH